MDCTRKTTFFEGWSWFKFDNLGLTLGTNLKFYTSVAKRLKLKIRRFWGLIHEEGLFAPSILNRVKAILSEKDIEIEALKLQVTLSQNHVSAVKHTFNKKVDELEEFGKTFCVRTEGVENNVNKKSEEVLEKLSIL